MELKKTLVRELQRGLPVCVLIRSCCLVLRLAIPAQDADISMRSRDEDDLPPLERARRRRSILPGGQTKLFG